jgi:hypothetical protein
MAYILETEKDISVVEVYHCGSEGNRGTEWFGLVRPL